MESPKEETCSSPKLQNAHKFGAFVILDLETSGIPENNFNEVSILEICMYGFPVSGMQKKCMKLATNEVNKKKEEAEAEKNKEGADDKVNENFVPTLHHKYKGEFCEVPPTPRTLSKLSLVVNPRCCIKPNISDLAGLDNYMLEDFGNFNQNTGTMLINFIKQLPQPVCLVAHNGKFDFPILKSTLTKFNVELPENVMCLDSLRAFFDIDRKNFLQQTPKANELLPNSESQKNDENEGEFRRELNESTPKRLIIHQDSKINRKLPITVKNDCTPRKCARHETPTTNVCNQFKSKRALFQDDKNINVNKDNALEKLIGKFYPPKNCYRLSDIYGRVHGDITNTLHRAETDVELLMRLVLHYGEDFLDYAQSWAVPYSIIPTKVRSTN